MARYRQKPELVEAKQFLGGAKNAKELTAWLKDKGALNVTWVDNQTVMDIHLVERLQFIAPSAEHIVQSVYRSQWIILKGDKWRVFSDRGFRERFETV